MSQHRQRTVLARVLGLFSEIFTGREKNQENCIFKKIDTFFSRARCFFSNSLAKVKKLPVRNFFHLKCIF